MESLSGGTATEGYETHLGLTLQVLLAPSSAAKPKAPSLLKHNKLYLMLPFTISMCFLKIREKRHVHITHVINNLESRRKNSLVWCCGFTFYLFHKFHFARDKYRGTELLYQSLSPQEEIYCLSPCGFLLVPPCRAFPLKCEYSDTQMTTECSHSTPE